MNNHIDLLVIYTAVDLLSYVCVFFYTIVEALVMMEQFGGVHGQWGIVTPWGNWVGMVI